MKFSPTVPLALALAAGMAVAAAAQTTPGTSEPKSTLSKPQAGSTQGLQGLNDNKATLNDNSKAASTTEMNTTEPSAERTAQMKAAHLKRNAHMRVRENSANRIARQPRRDVQARNLGAEPRSTQGQNMSSDQVKGAQDQLRQAGLYNGPSDGMMDPDTRAAIARYQQQNGLRRTETLDQQTLGRLNSNQQTTGFGSSAPNGNNQGTPTPMSAGGNATQQQPTQPTTNK